MGVTNSIPLLLVGCFILAAVIAPPFCNKIIMGSEVSAGKLNLYSDTGTRFISSSSIDPVAMHYTIEVSKLADSVPAEGAVKAYTYGSINEGRGDLNGLYETITFQDITSIQGSITKFSKYISYSSGLTPDFV